MERLDHEARQALRDDPNSAIAKHADLNALVFNLVELQQAAEGAAPHLVDFVTQTVNGLRSHLRDDFAQQLQQVLDKVLWPKKIGALPMSLLDDFNAAVNSLLTLQKPVLEQEASSTSTKDASILYPLTVFIDPLAARFQYHFSGDRPTNRLDKPEYFLQNFFGMLDSHTDFISEYIQPLLLHQLHDSKAILENPAYIDATTAYIHALLPMVRQRLLAIAGPVSTQPQLLSHLIAELLNFDSTLRNEWRYSPSPSDTWKGLTWELLTSHGYFDRWLEVEKNFAIARYNTIIDDKSTSSLDFESTTYSSHTSVPTIAAMRIHDLLTTITHSYRDIPSFSHRLMFLIDIQIYILDTFHARVHSGLEAYLSMTSSLGRTVQGVSAQDAADLTGVAGLDRLARVYGSAEYLEKAMRDWGDDVFFLDMWAELQRRARSRDSNSIISGPLDANIIMSKTSASLRTVDDNDDGLGSGALFDETAGNYEALREKSETILTDTLKSSVKESLRPYARNSSFVRTESGFSEADLTTSPDLQGAIHVLSQGFGFLAKALAAAPLRRVVRAVTEMGDDFIFDRVVLAKDFSLQGAKQMSVDVGALLKSMGGALGRKAGVVRLRRTEEGLQLLSLPVEKQKGQYESEDEAMTLWSVERRLFATNEDARNVLADMGCVSLNEGEARRVLRCRVELES